MSTRDGYVNPTWLDKEFMERALQEGNQDPRISVQDIMVRAATTVGENYASLMYRVLTKFITGSGKIEEKSFIVKGSLIPTSKEGENTLFETEIEMYSSILPKMADLYNELIHDETIHFAANSIFHTKNPGHSIILEDLGESSYQMSKRHRGLDLDHCKKVMSHLVMLPIILSKAEDTPDLMKMFKQNDEDTSHYSLEYKNEVKRVLPLFKEKGLFDF
ncbi:unnamed protein product [Timema podura]|uniref:Uncharacterized protein n=1 Tax=Timema podura TaxID=61482 RepID=A0ABN7NV71_TIMPD|nr:unnamed protein product [Timema podura]